MTHQWFQVDLIHADRGVFRCENDRGFGWRCIAPTRIGVLSCSVELDAESLAGLQALVADVGTGNVIDAELLDGCPVEAHELDEMDEAQAATVAAHCFAVLFDHRVQDSVGAEADHVSGIWRGTLMVLRT